MTRTHAALDAVSELVRPHKMRIEITPTVAYTATAPCLLAQLAGAVATGMETGGRGVPASRAPANVDVLDLWHEIGHNAHAWAVHVGGIARRDPRDGHAIPWIGRLLRTVTATAISKGHEELAERIRHDAVGWRARIEAMLTGRVEQRSIRGAACPECPWTVQPLPRGVIGPWAGPQPVRTIVEWREEEGRRVAYTVPAIVLVVREVDGTPLRWLACQACGWNKPLAEDGTVLAWSSDQQGQITEQAA